MGKRHTKSTLESGKFDIKGACQEQTLPTLSLPSSKDLNLYFLIKERTQIKQNKKKLCKFSLLYLTHRVYALLYVQK